MKRKLYVIGAGGVGGHIAQNIREYSDKFEVHGFFDDDPEIIGTKQFGFPVLGPVSRALELENEAVVIGIALPKIKKKIFEEISANTSLKFPALIHSTAWISKKVSIGEGTIVYPGVSVNYGTKTGANVVINMNCALGHHTKIGNYASLAPGVNTGGYTYIKKSADIGIGVSTLQNITIGVGSTVGGQAMVTSDIPPNKTAVGIPAKVI